MKCVIYQPQCETDGLSRETMFLCATELQLSGLFFVPKCAIEDVNRRFASLVVENNCVDRFTIPLLVWK